MNKWMLRIGVGLAVAVPMALFTAVMAGADDTSPPPAAGNIPCKTCHSQFDEEWASGAHGHATVDPTFQNAWKSQGEPRECLTCHTTGYDPATDTYRAEGITCEACHSPIPATHPKEPMPTVRSAALCGKCHTETMFEWQVSQHREIGVDCIGCHDPHAASLKQSDGSSGSSLCATCHQDLASNFNHSQHSQVGLGCPDCHMATLDGAEGEGHASRDHSFTVRLTTCNACHAYQMHDPVDVHSPQSMAEPVDAMASVEAVPVQAGPGPVSPVGFAALSGLIGMASGMVLAPWLERWYRRLRQDGDEAEGKVDDE